MREEDYAELFDRPEIQAAITIPHRHPSRNMLWLTQRARCYWCGTICKKPSKRINRKYGQCALPTDFFTIDHIHSRWLGGSNGVENVVGSCYRCNQLRNNAEHKREAKRYIPENQPEERRLRRLCPAVAHVKTISFEKGHSRRERKLLNLETKLLTCAFSCGSVSEVQ